MRTYETEITKYSFRLFLYRKLVSIKKKGIAYFSHLWVIGVDHLGEQDDDQQRQHHHHNLQEQQIVSFKQVSFPKKRKHYLYVAAFS